MRAYLGVFIYLDHFYPNGIKKIQFSSSVDSTKGAILKSVK